MQKLRRVLLFVGLLAACRPGKDSHTPVSDDQLLFGSGGGFTGAVTQYVLHRDGHLAATNSLTKETKELGRISEKQTAQLFQEAMTLRLDTFQFSYPGNLYYFIQLKNEATGPQIIWGSTEHPVPAGVQTLYDQLIQTIPD